MLQTLKNIKTKFLGKSGKAIESKFVVPKKIRLMKRLAANQLLTPYQDELEEIREIVGLTPEHFSHYYTKPLERYAELIQLAPASELHHHAHEGGMLEHNLQVIVNALRIRRGQILPPGVVAEDIERKKDIWTYAVFVSALLHDIGKPVTDFCYADQSGQQWDLLSTHPMPEVYEIRYRKGRVHKLHERLPMLVIHKIIDSKAVEWLASDPLVFQNLASFLSGDYSSTPILSEIIQKADQISVAENIGGDVKQVVATTAERPLHERFLHTIQLMLSEEAIPLNRKGAAAFTQDNRVYFVSKRLLDEVKDRMRKEGQSVPGRNDRMMDELQQFKVLIPNEDKAIWRCKVQIDDWEMNLSMLCFDAAKVWPSLEDRPELPTNQTITPIDVNGEPVNAADSKSTKTVELRSEPEKTEPVAKAQPKKKDSKAEPIVTDGASKTEPESKEVVPERKKAQESAIEEKSATLPEEKTSGIDGGVFDEMDELIAMPVPVEDLIGDFSEFADDVDMEDFDEYIDAPVEDIELPEPEVKQPKPIMPPPKVDKVVVTKEPEALIDREVVLTEIKEKAAQGRSNSVAYHNQKVAEQADIQIEFDDPDCPAAQFIKWLRDGVASAKIPANNPANQVHFVEDGLFLVSPAIFKTFERDTRINWTIAQRDLTKKKINLKTSRGDNIFQYEISSKSGRNASRVIKGILIPNPEKIGLKSSALNEYLRLINQ
ncbi:MobH family relaxase [Thiomicrorhabdus indica]|uniref:MobH family relaxase n=1 Tax=Thiomicrorhabdus indica TaxID=2267253 RepID=UPI00102E0590|nr:MobH family relaxase [Thiomicrorhabdus indica]